MNDRSAQRDNVKTAVVAGAAVLVLFAVAQLDTGPAVVLAIWVAYFIPTIVALARKHHQKGAIIVINVLLGWTFIGWVVALAMACGAVRPTAA